MDGVACVGDGSLLRPGVKVPKRPRPLFGLVSAPICLPQRLQGSVSRQARYLPMYLSQGGATTWILCRHPHAADDRTNSKGKKKEIHEDRRKSTRLGFAQYGLVYGLPNPPSFPPLVRFITDTVTRLYKTQPDKTAPETCSATLADMT